MSLFDNTDLESFKADRLLRAASTYFPEVTLSDEYLLGQILAAEADIGRRLKVFLEPTTIFPYEPTQAEIDALAGKPYAEEPGYDYDAQFFQADSWGYLVTRTRPIISVEFVRLAYPAPGNVFYTVPHDWLRIDKKYGHLRMVPATSTFTAPLSAFMMSVMGGGRSIPSMIQVKYVAGLADAKAKWPDLVDIILKSAVLKIVNESYVPQSGSISADGLSQSASLDTSKYEDMIEAKLFGGKGSNGGLWTAIHGVVGTIAGMMA